MKRALVFLLALLIFYPCITAFPIGSKNPPSNLHSRYVAVMDWDSGRILYGKDIRAVVPMASTTKIMTAIVAIENANLNDEVEVSKRASSIGGSTVGLKCGKKYTMEQLLYGLMLRSGNDCAIAVAEHTAGSVENFLNLMNTKAFELGAFDTHFTSPHGLDSESHFTTAYDLALVTRYALNNETFCRIVSSKEAVIDGIDGYSIKFSNINKILWQVDGADGVKTGYTGKAGKCLVSSAFRNGSRVICVVLNSVSRWEDSRKLLEYGFDNFKYSETIDKGNYMVRVPVMNGRKKSVKASPKYGVSIPVSEDEKCSINIRKEVFDCVEAPVYKGQQLGKLIVYANNKQIYSIPIAADEGVDREKRR